MKRTPLLRKTPLRAGTGLRTTKPMPKVRKGKARRTLAVRSEPWLDAVREIPCCVLCNAFGTEPAHRNEGKGAHMKTDDCATGAICRRCHHWIDNGNEGDRSERRALIDKAIVLTLISLVRAGRVGVLPKRPLQ